MTASFLEVFRALPGSPQALKSALAGVEEVSLVEAAARHGLAAVLQQALTDAHLALTPVASARLRKEAAAVIASALQVKALLAQSLDALAQRGVTPVLLKGYGFSSRYYAEPLSRPMGDVDLLVPGALLPEAEAALDGLGMARNPAPVEAYQREHHHHLNFVSAAGMVELHFEALAGLGSALAGEPLYARSLPSSVEGRPVRVLTPEDELVYLAAHAGQHLLARLAWLFDLKLLLRAHPTLDVALTVQRADESGLSAAIYLSLWAAQEALGARVPDALLEGLQPPAWQRAFFERFFSAERLVEVSWVGRKWTQYAASPLLATGLPRMARFTFHHLGRGVRRKVAFRFPKVTPSAWRG